MKLTIVSNSEITEHNVSTEEVEYFVAEQGRENGEPALSDPNLELLETVARSEIHNHRLQRILMWLSILIVLAVIAKTI